MLPIFGALAKAAAPFVLPTVANIINQNNQNKAAMDAYNKQRAAEKADQANKFVDMRNAAQKAGFNPLTVLRSTGGAGFGGTNAVMPVMSKQNFLATFAAKATGKYLENKANEPVDAYNRAVRTLDIQQRVNDIALSRKTLATMGKVPEQDRAMEVPILDPSTGKPILDDEGQPLFMHALNQEVQPMYIAIRNPKTGQVFGYPNPELADMGPGEFATFMALTTLFEKHAEDGTDFTWNGMGLPGRIRFDNGLRFPNSNNATQSKLPPLSNGWPQPTQ